MDTITVSICCITYNHENYIEDAIRSFINQKTNFKYEIVISNDCSTDKTQVIIDKYKKLYPNIIRDISPSRNMGSIANFYYTLNSCKGTYIAYCEGDDYWLDDKKLQKQVDFLEKNCEYGLCYTKSKKFIQNKNEFLRNDFGCNCCSYEEILYADRIPTQTIMFRSSFFNDYYNEIQPVDKQWAMGDLPILLYFSIKSKIFFMNEVSSVYRVLNNSANHQKNFEKAKNFLDSSKKVKEFFINKYSLNYSADDLNNRYYYNLFTKAFLFGDFPMYKLYYKKYNKTSFSIKHIILDLLKIRPVFFIIRKIYLLNHA